MASLSGEVMVWLYCNFIITLVKLLFPFDLSSGGYAKLLGMDDLQRWFSARIAVVLLAWVLWDCLVDDDMGKDVWHDPAFKVYRGLGNLVLLLLCWS